MKLRIHDIVLKMKSEAIVCSVDTIHSPHWVRFLTSLFWDFWWIIYTSSWFPTEFHLPRFSFHFLSDHHQYSLHKLLYNSLKDHRLVSRLIKRYIYQQPIGSKQIFLDFMTSIIIMVNTGVLISP